MNKTIKLNDGSLFELKDSDFFVICNSSSFAGKKGKEAFICNTEADAKKVKSIVSRLFWVTGKVTISKTYPNTVKTFRYVSPISYFLLP